MIQLFNQENRPSSRGITELIADEERLVDRSAMEESRYSWNAFTHLDITNRYVFLYLSDQRAIPIPKETVTEGDFDQIAEFCTEQIAAANATTS
jgi:hypothetical protein